MRTSTRAALSLVGGVIGFTALITTSHAAGLRPKPPVVLPAPDCPTGFARYEVHIGGQRLEAGFVPKDATPLVVVQNTEPGDTRYVVASVCLRPLTTAERNPGFPGVS